MGIPKMRSLLVLIGSLSSSPVVTDSVSVTTDKGTLRGTSRSVNGVSVSSYLGVPFAQPPINDLRFAAPQEESAWSGEWDATFKRPLCSQPANCSGCDVETTAEDCLYLNVFAPTELPDEPLPVYYWIHGGSFTGDWHPKWYNGEQLVGHGGVILVTVNYRLGALGFLSTGDGVIRGNQGMLDQQLGLDWIRTHIHPSISPFRQCRAVLTNPSLPMSLFTRVSKWLTMPNRLRLRSLLRGTLAALLSF